MYAHGPVCKTQDKKHSRLYKHLYQIFTFSWVGQKVCEITFIEALEYVQLLQILSLIKREQCLCSLGSWGSWNIDSIFVNDELPFQPQCLVFKGLVEKGDAIVWCEHVEVRPVYPCSWCTPICTWCWISELFPLKFPGLFPLKFIYSNILEYF